MRAITRALLLCAATGCALPAHALDGEIAVHDPSTVIASGGRFYTYGTGNGLPFLVSDDGWTWRRAGSLMSALPGAKPGAEVLARGGNNTWAPDVIHVGDKFYVYYAAPAMQPRAAIGLLVGRTLDPASPQYRWEDGGAVAWSDGVEDSNAIDPGVLLDPASGRLWLTYGSYFGYIRLVELDPKSGKRRAPQRAAVNIAINSEASVLIYHEGWYYLLVTHGSCCAGASSTYNIRMGRARKVTGPYLDNMGIDMLEGGGKLFAGSRGRHIGPGHFGLLDLGDGVQKFSMHYEADDEPRPPGRAISERASMEKLMTTHHKVGRALIALAIGIATVVIPSLASAQEVGMRPGGSAAGTAAAVVSPVVADGKVTFRLRAAEAKAVTVSGDFGPDVALSRDTAGVWSATVGPLKPDVYVYYFNVDGVRLPDPVNPQLKIGYVPSTTTSIVNVPGDGPAFYDVQDVPHGEIRTLLYKSRSNKVIRELNVYLPPGYDANARQRYPVLYLLHGFANDHHSWHRYGRANDILDNLLATKAIKPFIVVMPLGYGGASVNGDGTGIPPAGAGPFGGDFALYERDILEDVIPLIDGKYRTLANRENRAIIGFSMGGMQAGRFGLGHLDTFSYVGIMSAGLLGNPASAAAGPDPIAPLAANAAAANKQLKLLWIACGVDDTAMAGARSTHEALQKAGIKHTFVESEGAHHWRVWRRYLRDVSPLLFR